MTDKQLAANRRNALKSTGPKTTTGKARSSRNSLKHGVLSETPILKGVEIDKAWQEHRGGLFKSFSPVGYFEKLLTAQLAAISWRLTRVARYEAKVCGSAIANAETDLEEKRRKPSDPAVERAEAVEASRIAKLLEDLPGMADSEKLDEYAASEALISLSKKLPEDVGFVSVPGIPDDDAAFIAFDNWTAGLLRKAVELYAAAIGVTPEALRVQCVLSAREKHDSALAEERRLLEQGRRWKLLVEQENNSRLLLQPDLLERVTRYESNLQRSFYRTLHELQRLQAARSGAVVPPPAALDVDLTVHPETSVETADNAFEDEITKRTQLSREK